MTATVDAPPAVVPAPQADGKSPLHDCLEMVEDLRMEKLERADELDNLRRENQSLRESSAAFGALAERLSARAADGMANED